MTDRKIVSLHKVIPGYAWSQRTEKFFRMHVNMGVVISGVMVIACLMERSWGTGLLSLVIFIVLTFKRREVLNFFYHEQNIDDQPFFDELLVCDDGLYFIDHQQKTELFLFYFDVRVRVEFGSFELKVKHWKTPVRYDFVGFSDGALLKSNLTYHYSPHYYKKLILWGVASVVIITVLTFVFKHL